MWRQLGLPIVVSRWGARRGVQPVPMLEGLDALKIDVRLVNEIDLFPAARETLRELVAQAAAPLRPPRLTGRRGARRRVGR
jgi:hypothetical protein